MAKHTQNSIYESCTRDYLKSLKAKGIIPSPDTVEEELLDHISACIRMENSVREKGEKFTIPKSLCNASLALILIELHHAVNIVNNLNHPDYGSVAIYCDFGLNTGIYITNEKQITQVIRKYNFNIKATDVQEILTILASEAPCALKCREPNLVPVNNGIFDYDTKQLLPFSPNFVFTSKSCIDLNPDAQPVIIRQPDGTDWDFDSWLLDLASNDQEVYTLFIQIIGAVIRQNVRWNKSAWFYSESGNNGKGTLCFLLTQILGESAYATIPLSDLGKDFMLEPLTRSSAIIVDENDVGTYIDKAANLKSLITGDSIMINRKFKEPITIRWNGMIVQCLNEMPRIKDKSDSFFRRQLFVPFLKCFTGRERKYIKEDYLKRKDVLEYILKKVLMDTDYYELCTPKICKQALEEYKEYNDPILQFAVDLLPQCVWDLLPYCFLYDLYVAWFKKYNPNGTLQGNRVFSRTINQYIRNGSIQGWLLVGEGQGCTRTGDKMSATELLIEEYNLENWMNPKYKQSGRAELVGKCTLPDFMLKDYYKGLLRDTADNQTVA